jgi:uncharacterized protein
MTERPWMQTCRGQVFDLLDPDPATVDIGEIAYALAGANRFCGHSDPRWSIAAHSILVARLVETNTPGASAELMIAALLHDAHEAYIGDTTSPVKQALAAIDPAAMDAWRALEGTVQSAIHRALELPIVLPVEWEVAVKVADLRALKLERISFMAPCHRDWITLSTIGTVSWPSGEPRPLMSLARDPNKASEYEFLRLYDRYAELRMQQKGQP